MKKNENFRTSNVDEMFTLVKGNDNKVKIACGNYQVSKKTFDDFKQADAYLRTKPYEILVNVTCLFIDLAKKNEKK